MRGLGFPHLPLGPPGGQAPFPQRGWRDPPPTCPSTESGGLGRTARLSPVPSAQGARGASARKAGSPNSQQRVNRGGSDPRPRASEEDDPDARRAWGRRGGGRGRAVCGGAEPQLEFRLWPRGCQPGRGRPARPSCRVASPRIPDPLPGSACEAASAGRFSVTRHARLDAAARPPRRCAQTPGGVWLPDGRARSHGGASASPPRPLRLRPLRPNARCQGQRISCEVTTMKGLRAARRAVGREPRRSAPRAPALVRRPPLPTGTRGSLSAGDTVLVFPPLANFCESDGFLNTSFPLPSGFHICSL